MLLSTRARVIAIILTVMGSLGALFSCYGTLGLVGQLTGAAAPQVPPEFSAAQTEAFLLYLEQAQFIGLLGAFPNILSLFVSIFMVAAGVMTLSSKRIGMAPVACFGAALVDVVSVAVQILSLVLLMPYLDGFMAAMIPPGEPEIAEMVESAMGVSIAISGVIMVVIGLSFAAFWGWAGISLRNEEEDALGID